MNIFNIFKKKPTEAEINLKKSLELILKLRTIARSNRDFSTSDLIRDRLLAMGYFVADGPDGPYIRTVGADKNPLDIKETK